MFGITFEKSFPFIKAGAILPWASVGKTESQAGLVGRNVPADSFSDWFGSLPDKLPPREISNILRQALAGSLWYQAQLAQRMRDSWPIFSKCEQELRGAIASTKFVVHPFCLPNQKPTKSAEAKADLVRRAISGFKPSRFEDEDGFQSMVFDLSGALIDGVSIVEMLWDEDARDPNGAAESLIRACGWVHPRHYSFQTNGRVGVARSTENGWTQFNNVPAQEILDDPQKFIVAKSKSKSGSPLGAGITRKLAPLWVMVVYGRDFALNFAQKYGNPFLDVAYAPGLGQNQQELDRLEQYIKQARNSGWILHPDSSKVTVGMEHKMGGDNAQMALMKFADEQCQLLMLGQTLTTSVGNSGSRALGDVHENVRQEKIEELAKWMGRILTEQFAESLLVENYGESYRKNPERPTVEPDLTRPLSALEQADYLSKISNSRIPLSADRVYHIIGMEQPEPGDEVLVQGMPQILEEPMTATDKKQQDFEQQLDQQMTVNEVAGQAQGSPQSGEGQEGQVTSRLRVNSPQAILAALAVASVEERAELESLVTAAERAPHANGEVAIVQARVNSLLSKRRIKL
jgi:phage gp29-like protein